MVASNIKYIESVQTGSIATGGFGADFSADSLLNKHRPDLAHLPTTNGEHCTGDGLKMAMGIGADTVDLEWVQVHPTGLVHPDEPDAKVKLESGVKVLVVDKSSFFGGNSTKATSGINGALTKSQCMWAILSTATESVE